MSKGLIDRINYAERKRVQLLTQKVPKKLRQERICAYMIAIIRMDTILNEGVTKC